MKARSLKNLTAFIKFQLEKHETHSLTLGDVRHFFKTVVADQPAVFQPLKAAVLTSPNEPIIVYHNNNGRLMAKVESGHLYFDNEGNRTTVWMTYLVELVGKWSADKDATKDIRSLKGIKQGDRIQLEVDGFSFDQVKDTVKVRLIQLDTEYTTASEHNGSKEGSRCFKFSQTTKDVWNDMPRRIGNAISNQLTDFAFKEPYAKSKLYVSGGNGRD